MLRGQILINDFNQNDDVRNGIEDTNRGIDRLAAIENGHGLRKAGTEVDSVTVRGWASFHSLISIDDDDVLQDLS